ncbi:MAG TPA: DNA polymerase/3'-5' exonuclease PolX [Gaiellales bacterium]|nr:DNA polymerase/3'-5' exonuclease PolX [Gaiellales bacterium]
MSASLTNDGIAERFELLADLLELDGAVAYRVLAYRRAAKTLRDTPESVVRLSQQGRLTELPGVGDTIANKVAELIATGHISALEKLLAVTPAGVIPLMHVPGIGPKTARRVFTELGVTTVDEVLEAARDGRIRGIGGLGEKTEQAILEGLQAPPRTQKRDRVSSGKLRPFAERIVADLRDCDAVEDCDLAGSLRRFTETAKDVDVVVATRAPADVAERVVSLDWVQLVEARGETKVTCVAHDGTRVDVRMVEPQVYGNLLQHLTGSKDHNVALRESAVKAGLKVSEYGIEEVETGAVLECRTESEVYERLGMDWIPPELRENRGELEAARAHALPDLVTLDQIRGDLHAHTDWSDGKLTLEQLVAAVREKGLEYLNVTDHSPAVGFGMGLDAGRLRQQIDRVRALAETLDDFTLLAGAEVDILKDGSLDYSDELMAELDVVVASLHASHRLNEADQTKRLCAAMENPHVDVIGHPTGRMLGRRDSYPMDMEAVIAKAAETGTVLEVSGQPNRLDLRDAAIRMAVQAGVKLAVDTDAHSRAALEYMRFGVMNARRGWATAADVVNTRSWPELKKLLK